MEINSNNLINMSVIENAKKFDNIKTENMEDKKIREVSNEFEAFFLKQIMDISLKSTNVAGKAPGSDIVKGMYTQSLSDNAAGSMGISDMLYKFLSENNR